MKLPAIITRFLHRVGTALTHHEAPEIFGKIEEEKLDSDHIYRMLMKNKCPMCRASKLYEGPHGGMCVNIICGNCGCRFNYAPGIGFAEQMRGITQPVPELGNT